MTAKRKVVAEGVEMTAAARKGRSKVVLSPVPEWSEQELDRRWELIRVRGEKISADIEELSARINSRPV